MGDGPTILMVFGSVIADMYDCMHLYELLLYKNRKKTNGHPGGSPREIC